MSWSRTPRAVPMPAEHAGVVAWAPDELPATEPAPAVPIEINLDETEAALEEAYQRGRAEGRREAEAVGRATLMPALAALAEAAAEVRENTERWMANLEENVCAVTVAAARAILERELAVDGAVVLATVRAALAQFPLQAPLRVRVHPTDLERILGSGPEGQELAARVHLTWVPDATIVPGGCMVEGRERIVDGRVDVALERIYRRLVDADA